MQYRNVNRPAVFIEPGKGSVSPVMTGKPFPCNRGQGKTVLPYTSTFQCFTAVRLPARRLSGAGVCRDKKGVT